MIRHLFRLLESVHLPARPHVRILKPVALLAAQEGTILQNYVETHAQHAKRSEGNDLRAGHFVVPCARVRVRAYM